MRTWPGNTKRVVRGFAMALAVVVVAGCTIQTGPDGISGSVTLAGTVFTLTLSEAGVFLTRADAAVQNVVDVTPFADTSADEPASGYVRLRSSSIVIEPPDETAKAANLLDTFISGTATLRVLVDAGGAASPCDTGEELGSITITVEDCVVTGVSGELLMSLAAVDYFRKNSVSLCLEMRSDFGATIRLSGLEVIFGPAQPGSGQSQHVTFELRNADVQNIHLLMPGEEFREDLNRVTPGNTRTVNLDTARINDLFTIRAGRQEQVFSTVTCPPLRTDDTTYRVVWQGSSLTCEASTVAPPPEACCLPPPVGYENETTNNLFHQFCLDIDGGVPLRTRADCLFLGGVPQGEGTACTGFTCDAPFAACCLSRTGLPNYCNELTNTECTRLGGSPEPDHCDLRPCPETEELLAACCLDADCLDMDPAMCEARGGTAHTDGSRCADIACVAGACCLNGQCQRLFRTECEVQGGVYQGDDMSCSTGVCTVAACCWNGGCANADAESCADLSGGMYLGVTTDCSQDIIQCAEGACCWDRGCTESSREDCANLSGGVFQGWQSLCDDAPCATGACCAGDSCSVIKRSECVDGGAFGAMFLGPGTECSDALCGFGACCRNGVCTATTEAFCGTDVDGFTGTFMGPGVDCATVSCP